MSVIWFNGQLIPEGEARISVLDRGVIWGDGLFETLRAYGGQPWAVEDHYARLLRGSEVLDLTVPSAKVLLEGLREVVAENRLDEAGLRITCTRGAGPPDPHSEAVEPPNVFITGWGLRDYTDLYENGARLVTLPGGGRPLAGIKSTSYATSVAGRVAARRAGADDALFVAGDGRVLETTGSNVMILAGTRILTPPADEGVLPGITRRMALEVAESEGFEPEEAPLRVDDLVGADEVLLTSTLREVYGVRSIDGREVGRGEAAGRLRDAFHDAVLSALDR